MVSEMQDREESLLPQPDLAITGHAPCIHLLLWSARPSEARVTTIATLDCAAAHSLTLPHRPLRPPPGGAGDTWSVCQILTLPSPPPCLHLLLLALNQPSVRRARGDGRASQYFDNV